MVTKSSKIPVRVMTISLVVFAIPVVFFRGIIDTFDLTKATVLWIFAPVLSLLFFFSKANKFDRNFGWVLLAFLLALIPSWITSFRPFLSFYGQYQRNTGIATLFSCAVVAYLVTGESVSRRPEPVRIASSLAAFICSSYALFQLFGLDPFTWNSPGQNRPVFGTMGNVNTSSGFLSMVIPLIAFPLLNKSSKSRLLLALIGVAVVSAGIGVNQSFQGNVAGLVSVGLLINRGIRTDDRRHASVLLLAAVTIIIGSWLVEETWQVLLFVGACTLASLLALAVPEGGRSLIAYGRATRLRFRLGFSFVILLTAVGFVASWSRVLSEVRSGLTERSAFWTSAMKLWSERPFFGWGLETFGWLFTQERPRWHAESFEINRTSSVHSIPLGILFGGGLVLLIAFLALQIFVGVRVARALSQKKRGELRSTELLVWAAAWAAGLIQCLVSVEHVGLLFQMFLSAGMCVSLSTEARVRSQVTRRQVIFQRFALGASLLAVVGSFAYLTRPVRADFGQMRALEAIYRGSPDVDAISDLNRTIEIAPWEPQYKMRLINVLFDKQAWDVIGPIALDAATQTNFLGSAGIQLSYALAQAGQVSPAIDVATKTVDRDPYAPELKKAASELFAQLAVTYFSNGQLSISKDLVERAIKLDPQNQKVASLRDRLLESP